MPVLIDPLFEIEWASDHYPGTSAILPARFVKVICNSTLRAEDAGKMPAFHSMFSQFLNRPPVPIRGRYLQPFFQKAFPKRRCQRCWSPKGNRSVRPRTVINSNSLDEQLACTFSRHRDPHSGRKRANNVLL